MPPHRWILPGNNFPRLLFGCHNRTSKTGSPAVTPGSLLYVECGDLPAPIPLPRSPDVSSSRRVPTRRAIARAFRPGAVAIPARDSFIQSTAPAFRPRQHPVSLPSGLDSRMRAVATQQVSHTSSTMPVPPGGTRCFPRYSKEHRRIACWLMSADALVLGTSPDSSGFRRGRIPRPVAYSCRPSSPLT